MAACPVCGTEQTPTTYCVVEGEDLTLGKAYRVVLPE